MKGFGAGEVGDRVLRTPVWRGIQGGADGPGIDLPGIYVPTKFVRFTPVKTGRLDASLSVGEAGRNHIIGDMGRVFRPPKFLLKLGREG